MSIDDCRAALDRHPEGILRLDLLAHGIDVDALDWALRDHDLTPEGAD